MGKQDIYDEYYVRLHTFINTSMNETDRGRALIAASLIEEMLEEILRAFLRDGADTKKLFDSPDAPLSSLHSKTLMCRSLCLISAQEFADIDLVRKIRNLFAHSILCSFDDAKIIGWATRLKVGMSNLDALEDGDKSRVDDPKQRFHMVTASIVTTLYNRAHHVEKRKVVETVYSA